MVLSVNRPATVAVLSNPVARQNLDPTQNSPLRCSNRKSTGGEGTLDCAKIVSARLMTSETSFKANARLSELAAIHHVEQIARRALRSPGPVHSPDRYETRAERNAGRLHQRNQRQTLAPVSYFIRQKRAPSCDQPCWSRRSCFKEMITSNASAASAPFDRYVWETPTAVYGSAHKNGSRQQFTLVSYVRAVQPALTRFAKGSIIR
jgi:hypothetical protein